MLVNIINIQKEFPITYVSVIGIGGSLIEIPTEEGFTHFLEHLLYRQNTIGPERYTWEKLGGRVGLATTKETFRIELSFKNDDINTALDYLFNNLNNLKITSELINEEKKLVADEVTAQRNSTNYILAKEFYSIAFPNNYLSKDIGGYSNLTNINKDNITDFSHRFLKYFNPIVVGVGGEKINPSLFKLNNQETLSPNYKIMINKDGGEKYLFSSSKRSFFMIGVIIKGYRDKVNRKTIGIIEAFFKFGRASNIQKSLHYKLGLYFLEIESRIYNSAGTLFFKGSCPSESLKLVIEILQDFFMDISKCISENDFEIGKKAYIYELLNAEGNLKSFSVKLSILTYWGSTNPTIDNILNYKYSDFLEDIGNNVISRPISVSILSKP